MKRFDQFMNSASLIFTLALVAYPASSACAAQSFAGRWSRIDTVCKFACTKEDPEPDFEIRISIVLVQKGTIVCGVRDQNTLSDKAIVAGVRGKIVGTKLVMQTGDWEYDTIAPTFPFKPSEKNIALTRNGRLYVNGEVFTGKPFSVKDQKDYMEDEDRKGFFTACFKSTD